MAVITTEYKTVKETAEAWGVTKRWVNMCITDGRIPGVVRAGNIWLVPKDTAKPGDRRRPIQSPEESLSADLSRVIAAITISAPQGNPDAVLDTVNEERLRLIHEGALAYARGNFAHTIHCFRQNEGDNAAKLGGSAIAIAAAISLGDYSLYLEIENFLKEVIQANRDTEVSAFAELALSGGYLGAMAPNMIPDWLKEGDFSALPPQARPDAVYKRVKYFQCLGEYQSMLDIAETALGFCQSERELSFPSTYLTLLCAVACFATGRADEAQCYLLRAMRGSLPNGFITPFAEHMPLFGGMIERLLEREYPAILDAVLFQWKHTFANWLKFHNAFTKDNVTLILSLREYEMALLVAHGVSRAKIAEQFCISTGRLNNIMKEIYSKLFVSNRGELSRFIL